MLRDQAGEAKKGMPLGKYQLGRTLGEGNFGKVKYARHIDSGQSFAVKILDKARILDIKFADQVLRPTELSSSSTTTTILLYIYIYPHICHIYTFSIFFIFLFFVSNNQMELCMGTF